MEQAVCEYLSLDVSNTEILKERGQILISEIQELSTSRSNQLASIHNKRYQHFTTGIHSLDMMLNYMGKRCVQKNGRLAVHTALDLQQYIPNVITTEDCSHLLSDLLENAYHAACHANTPAIQLQFYLAEHAFIIEVSDNGIPFEPASLVQFGLTQRTTRAKDGGSGIGLMDIWRIKEKYRATLHIEELEPSAPYTKKLSFIFNRKNQYTIRTYRKEEIQKLVNRTDLQIYSHNH